MVNSFRLFYREFIIVIRDAIINVGNEVSPVRRFGASGQIWNGSELVIKYHVVLWAEVAGLEAEYVCYVSGV